MTNTPTRAYGFAVEFVDRYNCPAIVASVLVRENDAAHPINPASDGESAGYRGAPKAVDGMRLANLVIRHYRNQDGTFSGGPQVYFDEARFIDLRDLEKMRRTLTKVSAAIRKAQAWEPGDVLMAVAKAIGATFFVETRDKAAQYSMYSDTEWRFGPVTDARDRFRNLMREHTTEPAARNAA